MDDGVALDAPQPSLPPPPSADDDNIDGDEIPLGEWMRGEMTPCDEFQMLFYARRSYCLVS